MLPPLQRPDHVTHYLTPGFPFWRPKCTAVFQSAACGGTNSVARCGGCPLPNALIARGAGVSEWRRRYCTLTMLTTGVIMYVPLPVSLTD
jgi:hypothetical protein